MLWAEDEARKAARQWAKQLYRIRGTYLENADTFFSPKMKWGVASVSTVNPDDFWYKMELSPEELEMVKVSRLPTTVITANGSIDTTGVATVYVRDLDMFVTVQLLEDTPAVFSLCKSGKQHKTCSSALCTMDDASYFLVIRLGPKTSECEKNVTVVSTVTGCDVTNCATTLHGFNKHASSRREAVSDSRGVPRCTEKNSTNLRLLTCVDHSTRPIHHRFCLQLVFVTLSIVPVTR